MPLGEAPIIDPASLDHESSPALDDGVAAFECACQDIGFSYVCSRGVPEAIIEKTYRQARKLFALAEDIKSRVHCSSHSPVIVRGYVPYGGAHADAVAQPDLHEAFEVGLELPNTDLDVIFSILRYSDTPIRIVSKKLLS